MTARVLIAGAGIGGLAAALALLRAGHDVTVLEQARALRELGAGVQLGPNGTRVLLANGVFNPPFGLLVVVIGLAGIGIGGCQHGINALSGPVYPPAIRSTGAGWATGAGRIGARHPGGGDPAGAGGATCRWWGSAWRSGGCGGGPHERRAKLTQASSPARRSRKLRRPRFRA